MKKALLYFPLALQDNENSGIAKKCHHTAAQSPPLGAEVNLKMFKIYFFDIGISQRILGLDVKQWIKMVE